MKKNQVHWVTGARARHHLKRDQDMQQDMDIMDQDTSAMASTAVASYKVVPPQL